MNRMSLSLRKIHRKSMIFPGLLIVFFLGIGIAFLKYQLFSADQRFEALIDSIFQSEVTSSTLTLHYTLAHPESLKITSPAPTLGTLCMDSTEEQKLLATYEAKLLSYQPESLTQDHQITRDALLLYFHTRARLLSAPLLYEPLSPSLGIQAQLPVLLAEYAFYTKKDILDYLQLLKTIKPYFQSILSYEEIKARNGFFMSDATLDRILSQCSAFMENTDSNYMQEIFAERIDSLSALSTSEKQKLKEYHKNLLTTAVIPAYQMLAEGLESFRGSGRDSSGLCAYPGGRPYYTALLQSESGVYDPIPVIEKKLSTQLMEDTRQISLMLKEQPSLSTKLTDSTIFPTMNAEEILNYLQEAISRDFPETASTEAEIRSVHPSMEAYLSPAFYLTPPFDIGSPNVIYINNGSHAEGLELFTTLAHEGFPGHLYQTVFFEQKNSSPIRHLFSTGGYVEGWATYVETWAAQAAIPLLQDPAAKDLAHLYARNRSINLCIYSLLDIGIHYHGWKLANVQRYLSVFGIKDPDISKEIFQYIVENPANYPKYYLGCLAFLQLKNEQKEKQGADFDLKAFHQKVLSIGPVPFPVLKKYYNLPESVTSTEDK